MKRFRFRLEKVLSYRALLRKEAERELGMALAHLHEVEAELSKIRQLRLALQPADQVVSGAHYLMQEDFRQRLIEREVLALRDLEEAQRVVEEKRAAYRQARSEETAIERLKEKKVAEYKHEIELESQLASDELASQRHVRRLKMESV